MFQMAKIKWHAGEFLIYHDTKVSDGNLYRIYFSWNSRSDHGIVKHKQHLQRYGDYESCISLVWMIMTGRDKVSNYIDLARV